MQDTYPSLFWGYTIIWVLVVLYSLWLGTRLCRIEKTIEKIKSDVEN